MDTNYITVEYSNDSGNTWSTYNISDEAKYKTNFVSGIGYSFNIGGPDATTTPQNQLKITIEGNDNLYFELQKIAIYSSTGGASGYKVKVEAEKNPTGETIVLADTEIKGWPAWNIINPEKIIRLGTGTSSVIYNKIYLTFSINEGNSQTTVNQLAMYGVNCWRNNSNMATNGHLYSYDYNQKAIFPGYVAATKFVGNLDGTASKATNATNAANATKATSADNAGMIKKQVYINANSLAEGYVKIGEATWASWGMKTALISFQDPNTIQPQCTLVEVNASCNGSTFATNNIHYRQIAGVDISGQLAYTLSEDNKTLELYYYRKTNQKLSVFVLTNDGFTFVTSAPSAPSDIIPTGTGYYVIPDAIKNYIDSQLGI